MPLMIITHRVAISASMFERTPVRKSSELRENFRHISVFSATRREFQFQFRQLPGWSVNRVRFLWHFVCDEFQSHFICPRESFCRLWRGIRTLSTATSLGAFQRFLPADLSKLPSVNLITQSEIDNGEPAFDCNFAVPFADENLSALLSPPVISMLRYQVHSPVAEVQLFKAFFLWKSCLFKRHHNIEYLNQARSA